MSALVIAFLHETDRYDVFSLIAVLAPIPAVMSVSQCESSRSRILFHRRNRETHGLPSELNPNSASKCK